MKSELPTHQERSPNEQIKSIFPGINPCMLSKVVRERWRKNHPYEITYQVRLNPPIDNLGAYISMNYNPREDSLVRSMQLTECGGKEPFGMVELINPAVSTCGLQPLKTHLTIQFHEEQTSLIYRINNGILQRRYVDDVVFQPAKEQSMCLRSKHRSFYVFIDRNGLEIANNHIPFFSTSPSPTSGCERFFL